MKVLRWLSFLAVVLVPSSFQAAEQAPAKDKRLALLDALKQELARSKEKLRLPGEDPPYFIRYLVREYDDYDLSARFGALLEDSYQNVRQGSVEVRVGDYHFDNTADDSTEKMFDLDDLDRYDPPVVTPLDNDLDSLRATMWLQTDAQYKKALSLLHKKRGNRVTRVVEDESVGKLLLRVLDLRDDDPVGRELTAARERALRAGLASFEHDVFPALLARGARIAVRVCDAPFIDIGTEDSLAQADAFVQAHARWFS